MNSPFRHNFFLKKWKKQKQRFSFLSQKHKKRFKKEGFRPATVKKTERVILKANSLKAYWRETKRSRSFLPAKTNRGYISSPPISVRPPPNPEKPYRFAVWFLSNPHARCLPSPNEVAPRSRPLTRWLSRSLSPDPAAILLPRSGSSDPMRWRLSATAEPPIRRGECRLAGALIRARTLLQKWVRARASLCTLQFCRCWSQRRRWFVATTEWILNCWWRDHVLRFCTRRIDCAFIATTWEVERRFR